jgi:hypothetical protein
VIEKTPRITIPLLALPTILLVSSVSCFDNVEQLNNNQSDAGVAQYANWGSFSPGTDSSNTEGDVDRAFGPPDGAMLHLGNGGVLIISFSDNRIYDHSGPEFTIHGVWESGEVVTVLGSETGADYRVIGTVDGGDPNLDITEGGFGWVTYLQIQDSGSGNGVEIDAVEVQPAP